VLARRLQPAFCEVRVIDLRTRNPHPAIATLRPWPAHALLDIDEADLMRRTQATARLEPSYVDSGTGGRPVFPRLRIVGARLEAWRSTIIG